jgi:hypothetical protein
MARIRAFRKKDVKRCMAQEIKRKGRRTGPFLELFLLPVGLADFMERDAKAYLARRQQEIVTEMCLYWIKKTAPFQGRGKSNREEVTPAARSCAFGKDNYGTERLTMYFDIDW